MIFPKTKTMSATRNGKIARLPRPVRNQLDLHLDNGMEAEPILEWVNALPETQALLRDKFEGKPINPQNLTEWRQGGHQDWLRNQQRLELARHMAEHAQDLDDPREGPRLTSDQLGLVLTVELAAMVKEGTEFEVQDARTGEDITRSVLTQIIFEEEAKGQSLLPIKFLRQLIRFYGDSLQAFVPGYLDMSMEGFTKNQGAMRDRIAEALGGGNQMVENLTRQNLVMFEKAMQMSKQMFTPFVPGATARPRVERFFSPGHRRRF